MRSLLSRLRRMSPDGHFSRLLQFILEAWRGRDIRQLLTAPGTGVVAPRAVLWRLKTTAFIDRPLAAEK